LTAGLVLACAVGVLSDGELAAALAAGVSFAVGTVGVAEDGAEVESEAALAVTLPVTFAVLGDVRDGLADELVDELVIELVGWVLFAPVFVATSAVLAASVSARPWALGGTSICALSLSMSDFGSIAPGLRVASNTSSSTCISAISITTGCSGAVVTTAGASKAQGEVAVVVDLCVHKNDVKTKATNTLATPNHRKRPDKAGAAMAKVLCKACMGV
jgi:hypothetical protein